MFFYSNIYLVSKKLQLLPGSFLTEEYHNLSYECSDIGFRFYFGRLFSFWWR